MWPTCVNELEPFHFQLELPAFLRKASNSLGIVGEDLSMPVKIVSLLGSCSCSTELYPSRPNMLTHHIENSKEEPSHTFQIGKYYWLDFDAAWSGLSLPLRTVYNTGDADSNTGFWGTVWERNRGEIIANIMSTGDCETTIQVLPSEHSDIFRSHDIPALGRMQPFLGEVVYAGTVDCHPSSIEYVGGVMCPREGCGGEIVERKSRRVFYGCSLYGVNGCTVAFWSPPVGTSGSNHGNNRCPQCDSMLLQKTSELIVCSNNKCNFARDLMTSEDQTILSARQQLAKIIGLAIGLSFSCWNQAVELERRALEK